MRNFCFAAICMVLFGMPKSSKAETTPIEAFAKDQSISKVRISPNGKMLAFVNVVQGNVSVIIQQIGGDILSIAPLVEVKPSNIRWAGNEYILITVSGTDSEHLLQRGRVLRSGHQKSEYYRTFSFNIKTRKIVKMLTRSKEKLAYFSINLGAIIGVDHENPAVFIPAFNEEYQLQVFRVDLDQGNGVTVGHGLRWTNKWILDSKNTPIVRVIHNQDNNQFRIQKIVDNDWKNLVNRKREIAPYAVIGLNTTQTALIVKTTTSTVPFSSLYEMDFETGEIGKPLFQVEGHDLGGSIIDPYTNLVVGTSWIEDQDQYHWFDEELGAVYKMLKTSLQGYAVRLTSWSIDRKVFLISIAKLGQPVRYGVFDVSANKLDIVASSRPQLANLSIGQITGYHYDARDGLTIPAYLTLPPGETTTNLPLVVLPHGGPEARDSANFDWLTQLLANRGYAVFQPNFRGSSGYGWGFSSAGWGEWGKAMQDDITDGVQDLIAKGTVDPNRICIVGASYGGYAALAGGAFTPDLYQCVVSIAGVSDLGKIYQWSKGEYGRNHWVIKYWDRSMTGDEDRNSAMKAASPIKFTDQFKAPVLLIHGKDDTVVPVRQSQRMNKALKKAKVDVRFIQQKNGDHWMSFEATRLETAREVVAFLDAHIGAK